MPNPSITPLTLASTSPYRAALLRRLRLPFTTVAPGVVETPHPDEQACDLAERLAIAKAHSVSDAPGWVIGSDQVAVVGDSILGKPGTAARAEAQLAAMAGQTVTFYTGVAIWSAAHDSLKTAVVPYRVLVRALTADEIRSYVALDQPMDCAGSFKWESLGITLFDAMQGDDPTALEGLPLITLSRLLREVGFAVPPAPEFAANA